MRYHTLLYAGLLPTAVFAQSAVPVASGIADHSGGPSRGNHAHRHNATHPIFPGNITGNVASLDDKLHQSTGIWTGVGPKQSAKTSGEYIATTLNNSKHGSATNLLHGPYTRPVGAFPVNYNNSYARPTGSDAVAHSGTGPSGGFLRPTETGSNSFTYSTVQVTSSTGNLPIPVTKGSSPHFFNITGVNPSGTRTSLAPTGSAASSGFANPSFTETETTVLTQSASTSGRVPFTKSNGFHFANSTSGFAMPTGPGYVHPTIASSSFARPTVLGHHTDHLANGSTAASTSARLPFTKSNGFHFANSTVLVVGATGTAASGFVKPTNSRTVSTFPTASGHQSHSRSYHSQSNSTSYHVAFPTGYIPSGAEASGISSTLTSTASVIPIPSGHLPYTNSTGFVFSNSTSVPPVSGTGMQSTQPLATTPFSTGVFSTGLHTIISTATGVLSSKPTSALSVNSTSTNASTVYSPTTGIPSAGTPGSTISIVPTTMITKVSPTRTIGSSGIIISTSRHTSPSHTTIPQYYQCGGINFKGGAGICAKGTVCKKWNPYYHQCVDERYA